MFVTHRYKRNTMIGQLEIVITCEAPHVATRGQRTYVGKVLGHVVDICDSGGKRVWRFYNGHKVWRKEEDDWTGYDWAAAAKCAAKKQPRVSSENLCATCLDEGID